MSNKYTRKFKVQLEGQEEPLMGASLTAGQTDEFLVEQAEALALKSEEQKPEREKRMLANSYNFVMNSLNNALTNGDEKWTVDRIKAELDKDIIDELMSQAMARSGLARPKATTPSTTS